MVAGDTWSSERLVASDNDGSCSDTKPACKRASLIAFAVILIGAILVAIGICELVRTRHKALLPSNLIVDGIGGKVGGKNSSEDETPNCNSTPIVGPDEVPAYNHKACMSELHYTNNCYNYALDIVGKDWLLPGFCSNDSDMCRYPYNCEFDIACAEADGLKFIGKSLPLAKLTNGHYVALLDGGRMNGFHWIRKDKDGYWSYKNGPGNVSNVDYNGNLISDPANTVAAGALKPFTQFCGYFIVVPSEVVKRVCCDKNNCCGDKCSPKAVE